MKIHYTNRLAPRESLVSDIPHCYPFHGRLVLNLACTVVGLNGTLVEAKMFTFTLECTHFIFNKCPIKTHDGANAKFGTI
jgi:hypothetical protein